MECGSRWALDGDRTRGGGVDAMRNDEPSIERFREAQEQRHIGFVAALDEIRSGSKQGHWIWYVFPQIAGLGTSAMSQAYGIRGLGEATAYLRDPVLGPRLLAITEAAVEQLRRGTPLPTLMGSDIDATKLVSSLTLFGRVAGQLRHEDPEVAGRLADLADELLGLTEAQGYPPCRSTLASLGTTL